MAVEAVIFPVFMFLPAVNSVLTSPTGEYSVNRTIIFAGVRRNGIMPSPRRFAAFPQGLSPLYRSSVANRSEKPLQSLKVAFMASSMA